MARRRPVARRFTPTGVGTICCAAWSRPIAKVHPHGRGDNLVGRSNRGRTYGSPPRAWGQCGCFGFGYRCHRFTPTGVGTIDDGSCEPVGMAVHPHGRGDNERAAFDVRRLVGSPPRAWGQSTGARCARTGRRFTPTGVGTMSKHQPRLVTATVHPHGRGDNVQVCRVRDIACGSPPRAWGQSGRRDRAGKWRRFTPTGVGTMICPGRGRSSVTVHPHGRGDNPVLGFVRLPMTGSPPRAWGQFDIWNGWMDALRFTPTGVGTIRRV